MLWLAVMARLSAAKFPRLTGRTDEQRRYEEGVEGQKNGTTERKKERTRTYKKGLMDGWKHGRRPSRYERMHGSENTPGCRESSRCTIPLQERPMMIGWAMITESRGDDVVIGGGANRYIALVILVVASKMATAVVMMGKMAVTALLGSGKKRGAVALVNRSCDGDTVVDVYFINGIAMVTM
jgi:hypothetical protein